MSIELEWREEIYFFYGLDAPSRKEAETGFGKCFDPHDAGKDWRAVDLVVM